MDKIYKDFNKVFILIHLIISYFVDLLINMIKILLKVYKVWTHPLLVYNMYSLTTPR